MSRNLILVIVLVAIAGAIYYLQPKRITPTNNGVVNSDIPAIPVAPTSTPAKPAAKPPTNANYPRAKELVNPSGFINTAPFKIADLIGKKVILVDFWTYSCINCQRTTPYLNAWYDKYQKMGLEIVGVHTPEFEFEKDYDNVKKAVENEKIKYPVVLDNDYGTWSAYGNRYWPRKYLIDLNGNIVYDHIGEGAYEETEMKIKELLGDLSKTTVKPTEVSAPATGQLSPETYFGSNRNNNFSGGLKLIGNWDIQPEFARNQSAGDKITFPYQAKNVFFVASAKQATDIEISVDGKLLKTITVQDAKLYTLIQHNQVEAHQLEITVKSPGLEAYTFTFG